MVYSYTFPNFMIEYINNYQKHESLHDCELGL